MALLALIVAPALIWLDIAKDGEQAAEVWRDHCTSAADYRLVERIDVEGYSEATKACWDDWSRSREAMAPGWPEYWYALLGTAVVLAVAYLLALAAVWTGKWVLRGRSANMEFAERK